MACDKKDRYLGQGLEGNQWKKQEQSHTHPGPQPEAGLPPVSPPAAQNQSDQGVQEDKKQVGAKGVPGQGQDAPQEIAQQVKGESGDKTSFG